MHPNDTTPLRRCTQCGQQFPATLEYFGKKKNGKYGLRSWCKACTRAYRRKYYKANRLRCIEYAKRWNREHPERKRENSRKHRQAFPEKARARTIAWRRKNKEWANTHSRIKRARKRNAPGTHTIQDVRRQYNSQQGRCYWCGCEVGDSYHVDHVIPLSKGGSNGPENIVIACPPCNMSKQDMLPEEWLAYRNRLN